MKAILLSSLCAVSALSVHAEDADYYIIETTKYGTVVIPNMRRSVCELFASSETFDDTRKFYCAPMNLLVAQDLVNGRRAADVAAQKAAAEDRVKAGR
jgi:hypothetical protein